MRFEENRIDQFFSTQKVITQADKDEMINEFHERGREALSDIRDDIKARFRGEEPSKPRSPYLSAGDQGNNNSKKHPSSLLLIVVFIALVIAVIIFSAINVMIAGALVFFGFAFFGFYLYATDDGRVKASDSINGSTSENRSTTPLIFGIIGLCGAIPLCFYGLLGTKAAGILTGVSLFAAVGIYFLFMVIRNLYNRKNKYTEEVVADCIGYARIIESNDSNNDTGLHQASYVFMTSPVFEYTYNGIEYTGMYDLLTGNTTGDVDLGRTTIMIDPNNPTDIGRKSQPSGHIVINLMCSLLSIAVAVILLVFFLNTDFSTDKKMSGLNFRSFAINYMLASDDEKENLMMGFMDQIDELYPDYTHPSEITDEYVCEMDPHSTKDTEWYYEIATVTEVNKYEYDYTDDDGTEHHVSQTGYVFVSDIDNVTFCGINTGDTYQEGDKAIVFYTVNVTESNDRIYTNKAIFLNMKADGHSYTGSHKAYGE